MERNFGGDTWGRIYLSS